MFSINLLVASILLGWRVFAICAASGLYLAFELHQFYDPNYILDIEIGSPAFIATYTLMLIGASTILFIKPRQEQVEQIEDKNECLKKEIDYTQRELDNIKQGFDFLEKQFEQKAGNLKEKEVYLRDQVKIRNTEISKLTNIKDEFLRNITHESNTPMTGIISMSEVLYSCYDKLDNKLIKRTIKDIVNSSDRLKTYVNSIVDLSKLSSSQYKLNKEAINLGELAKERTILYKKVFSDDKTKQEFIFNIGDGFIVNCDRYYITQTIDNLISNASNYGRGKSITISIKRKEDCIKFSISDQGIGIPETELLSIFAKFSTSSRTSTPSGGRGVGLALCKSVIEAHEGNIKATSSKGEGAIFTFTLPNVA
jgi:signal transduction histidine kinase